jgi:phosphoglycerate dehydrogenase-like enzyme
MMQVQANKTLKGHKAIILTIAAAPQEQIDAIRKQFPDLKIVARIQPWGEPLRDDFPEEEWKDATILLTSTVLPTRDVAPNLQYVQLAVVGTSHILDIPLFKETDIPFSTASGVHGYDEVFC